MGKQVWGGKLVYLLFPPPPPTPTPPPFSSLHIAVFGGLDPSSHVQTLLLVSPWNNRSGWLGVKHRVTYLLSPPGKFYDA